jgi:ADP-L-glycero-D-manno-heptose 6-epimerase
MIILTGGAGFIGSGFLWKLNSQGIDDIIVVDELDESEKWKNLVGKKFIDYIQKDEFLRLVVEDKLPVPTKIIHLGACSSTTCKDGSYFIQNNYEYSKILAQWAFLHQAAFIYASSAATYGDGLNGYSDNQDIDLLKPLNMYGYSKHLFDLWMRNNQFDKKATAIKFFNVFGPNEYHKNDMSSVVCKKFNEVKDKGCISLFKSYHENYKDGQQQRDFIYIKDVVEIMYWMFNNPKATGIFNLGTGKAQTWNDLACAMFKAMGKTAKINYIDMPEYLQPKYQYYTCADMEKLRKAGCDFKFNSLENTVADYVKYLDKNAYL